jgi:prepilin-type N-terminal cleavage/methylation domain-containing protein
LPLSLTQISEIISYTERVKVRKISRPKRVGFTLIEILVTLAIFSVLAALARPAYYRAKARGSQADAKLEISQVYMAESTFKESFKTYHMHFPEMGLPIRNAIPTNLSSASNTYLARTYAISAGGPISTATDDPKPVTFASLSVTITRPDPKLYTGWIAPNSISCGVNGAASYGATGGATPTSTQATLLITAKGCPTRYSSTLFDTWSIDQDGIVRHVTDGTNL